MQTAAATGGVRGGNTAGALAQLGPDVLAKVYDMALNGYGNLAQLGLGATGSVSAAGTNNANAATTAFGNIGQAQATNYLTKAGINAANWNNAGAFADQIASSFAPGGAGMSGAMKSIF